MFPEIRDCEHVDAVRSRASFCILVVGIGLLLISLSHRPSSPALVALFSLLGAGSALERLANFLTPHGAAKSEKRWRHSSKGVEFFPQQGCTSGKYISCLVVTMSTLIPCVMVISARFADAVSWKVLLHSSVFGAIAAMIWLDLPFNRPGRPAIEVDSAGIHFWRSGIHPTYVAWDASPFVVGCKSVRGMPHTLIDASNGLSTSRYRVCR